MNKSVLVIDTPANCNECRLLNYEYGCPIIGATGERNKGRSEWCPLRPLPSKKQIEHRWFSEDYSIGWNACLDEITGETE